MTLSYGAMTDLLLIAIPAFCIACALTLALIRAGARLGILDHPNERSLHDTPRPRTGGLAIWAGCLVGLALLPALFGGLLPWLAGAVLVVGAISFADDRSPVPAAWRLAAHLLAAGLVIGGGLGLTVLRLPGMEIALGMGSGIILTVLLVVWMTNLYNFMDGIDGLAGGMAVFGFGALGVLGLLGGDAGYTALCAMIAAASAGFLVWNFPPARIFMGDSGSSVLGLLAAMLSLWADRTGLFPLWIGLLVFSPFVVDTSLTLLRRTLRGTRIWEAHREHYYQRLVRAGWSHRRVTLYAYGLMATSAAAAVFAMQASALMQWMLIGAFALLYGAAITGVGCIEARRTEKR